MSNSKEPSWHFDPIVNEHFAAFAWGVSTDKWDQLDPEHQGRMLETYRAKRTMSAWEMFVNRPK